MPAAKTIRFAQALVSLLSLEASMLAQFGSDESYRRLMIALTGAAVCVIVLSTSIVVIVSSSKKIKKLQSGEECKKHGWRGNLLGL